MLAIEIKNDVANWIEHPDPVPKDHEVLIDVHASAVNRADLVQRAGRYNPPEGASKILGLEAAGVVSAVGPMVTSLAVGDRVCALLTGGGYAEKVCANEHHCFKIPDHWEYTYAAAIPEVFITAYVNLFEEASLKPHESALIWAAASGVGTAALQLCREENITTHAVCSAAKHEKLAPFSPTYLFDRRSDSLFETLEKQGKVDVILDPVATNLEANLSLLNRRGRLVIIGLLGGREANLPLARLLVNRLSIIGSVLRSRSDSEKSEIIARFKKRFWLPLITKAITPVIDSVFDIKELDAAHALLAENNTIGKIILKVR